MKKIAILGATGSIGQSAIDIIKARDDLEVSFLIAHSNFHKLAHLAIELSAKAAIIMNENLYPHLQEQLAGTKIKAMAGHVGLMESLDLDYDIAIMAITGAASILPTYELARRGKRVALASKEAMVCAGSFIMQVARARGGEIIPVDSEHNAIFQLLEGKREGVDKIYLTASGGPFWRYAELAHVGIKEALAHPNWKMGDKITIDSATMMNKGLELLEAYRLFALPPSMFDAVIHPQSLIHGMVEYQDGSVIAHMARPDMKLPIAYAIDWPAPSANYIERLRFSEYMKLEFFPRDDIRFPCLRLAIEVLQSERLAPAIILNAANEIAVAKFLAGEIKFIDIYQVVADNLAKFSYHQEPESIQEILQLDEYVRRNNN